MFHLYGLLKQYGFLKKGMDLMISTPDANKLKSHMFTEMVNISSRHKNGADLFKKGEKYAPSFGMMGTVMGLIIMMNGFDTSGGQDTATQFANLLKGMATALVTTLYGVIFANLIFLPIAAKLERRSINELRHKEIVAQGILMLHAKEHPILIKEKLMNFVPKEVKKTKTNTNISFTVGSFKNRGL